MRRNTWHSIGDVIGPMVAAAMATVAAGCTGSVEGSMHAGLDTTLAGSATVVVAGNGKTEVLE